MWTEHEKLGHISMSTTFYLKKTPGRWGSAWKHQSSWVHRWPQHVKTPQWPVHSNKRKTGFSHTLGEDFHQDRPYQILKTSGLLAGERSVFTNRSCFINPATEGSSAPSLLGWRNKLPWETESKPVGTSWSVCSSLREGNTANREPSKVSKAGWRWRTQGGERGTAWSHGVTCFLIGPQTSPPALMTSAILKQHEPMTSQYWQHTSRTSL